MRPESPAPESLDPGALERVLREAAEQVRLNEKQAPRKYPGSADEETLARLD